VGEMAPAELKRLRRSDPLRRKQRREYRRVYEAMR
jgi:hypothetical protein